MSSVRIFCFFVIFVSNVAFAETLKIVNSQERGYLLKVPESWKIEGILRGSISEVVSSNGTAGVTIRIKDLQSGERFVVAEHKNELTQRFSEFPDSLFHSYKDGVSVYDIEIDYNERNKLVRNHIRLMCYTDQNVALFLEGKCTVGIDRSECDQVKDIIDSFWVYNKDKFSAIYASYL